MNKTITTRRRACGFPIGLALALFILVSSFTACSESGGTSPKRLSIGTAPAGGAFFPVGTAIAETLNQSGSETSDEGTKAEKWMFSAESTKGTQENIRRLDQGDLELALANSAITYFAVRGEGDWKKAYPMRVVMTLAPNIALFVTKADSGIKSLADLKEQRVSVGPAGAGFEYFLKPLLAAHGVQFEDFSPQNANQSSAVDLLSDGAISAAFLGGAIPTASITQAARSMDLLFLPFDQGAKTQLTNDFLFFRPATIPAETYHNQSEPFEGLDVGSMHLITHESVADDLIYDITKALYENRAEVVKRHGAGRAINEKNIVRDTGTPFHPGAIRYFTEIGIWPEGQ